LLVAVLTLKMVSCLPGSFSWQIRIRQKLEKARSRFLVRAQ
jgi:hypothetical protein